MAKRDLYIVAANRKDLYEQLRRQFAGNASVEIILDRRKLERRRGGSGVANDQRRADRRVRDDAHLLKTLGVVLVSIERDEPAGPAAARPAAAARAPAPARRRTGARGVTPGRAAKRKAGRGKRAR